MTDKRLRRPKLERSRPIRTWGTLFRPPSPGTADSSGPEVGSGSAPGGPLPPRPPAPGFLDPRMGQTLADSVDAGYRVINDYLRQAQTMAQALNPPSWTPSQASPPADPQQMAQRAMQYGLDFAGAWFETWQRIAGGSNGWPSPFPGPGNGSTPWSPAPAPTPDVEAKATHSLRLLVSVESGQTATATLEWRGGPPGAIVLHALRPEGHSAPPIKKVNIKVDADRQAIAVKVVVPRRQPPGNYRGAIVDTESNLPRGSVSVRVYAKGGGD